MFLIVGLGNPGEKYTHTRHNIGFMAVEKLAERADVSFKSGRGNYVYAKATYAQNDFILLKPLTYMNLSGEAVGHAVNYWKIPQEKTLIVYDDFNIPFGTVRLRPSGSAGGQKGLQSILQVLKTQEISRLRLGVGGRFSNAKSFVLSPFNNEEKADLPDVIDWAADAVEAFMTKGVRSTMNVFNRNMLNKS